MATQSVSRGLNRLFRRRDGKASGRCESVVGNGSEVCTRPAEDEPIPGFSDELPFSRRACRWHSAKMLRKTRLDPAMQDRFRRCAELAGPGHMAAEWCNVCETGLQIVLTVLRVGPGSGLGIRRGVGDPQVHQRCWSSFIRCLHVHSKSLSAFHPDSGPVEAERPAEGSKTSSKASTLHLS